MRKILLSVCATMLLGIPIATAQLLIRGVVKNPDGESIVGATVQIQGTTRGVVTNAEGSFEVSTPANSTLVISFIGYQTKEVEIGNRTRIDVTLEVDTQTIDDVIVVAFGTTTRETYTGSVSVIKAGDLVRRQTSTATQALAGQVAGVQIVNTTGQPGTAGIVRIRGIGSMNASSAPLYVLDGVPFDGDISSINPSDIESMSVLKDAAASALYGARGANGVIMITTKRGRLGDATVTLDTRLGVNSRAIPEYDIIRSPATWMETAYKARYNYYIGLGNTPANANTSANTYLTSSSSAGDLGGYNPYTVPTGEKLIGLDGKLNPNATLGRVVRSAGTDYFLLPDDWGRAAYNNGLRQEYNLNVSGATEKMNYFFSTGYLNDRGYVVRSGFERISARLKADYQAKKWLRIGGNVAYANNLTNNPQFESTGSTNIFYLSRYISPVYPLYVRDGEGNILIDRLGLKVHDYGDGMNAGLNRHFMSMANPISAQYLNRDQFNSDIFSGRTYAEVTFLKDFKATLNGGLDLDNTRYVSVNNPFYGQFAQQGGTVYVEHSRNNALNLQQLLTWGHDYGDHHVDALLGHEFYRLRMNELWGNRNKMYNYRIGELDNAIKNPDTGSKADEYSTEGYFTRVQYDYARKYFFSASYRLDASSRFAPSNRWGNFGSVSASWLLNNEEFLRNVSWINLLKYKVSYGAQGNDALILAGTVSTPNYYPYLDQYRLVNNGGEFALSLNNKGNYNIKWESNHNFNTGVEFGFFNNRLMGGVEFFTRISTDLLFNRPVPTSLGYNTFPDNTGRMRNTGVEFELHGVAIEKQNFRWTVSLNGTHFRNKIISLPEESKELGIVTGRYKRTEGGSMFDYYLREFVGVDPDTGKSLYSKVDQNGNKTTTTSWEEATLSLIGKSALSSLFGGINTAFEFYGVDISLDFTYQLGGWAYDSAYAGLMHGGDSDNRGRNWHRDILKAWTPESPSSSIPILNRDRYANAASSRFLINASYFNIQNITIGYRLPANITKKLGIGMLRVYAVGDNMLLFSKRKGLDPRTTAASNVVGNIDVGTYSAIRTVSGGIQIQF